MGALARKGKQKAFTIVELLVVIVVIGIISTIVMVSYSSVTSRALIASIQSDLSNAALQIKLFKIANPNENYPTTIDCGIADSDTNKCIKSSGNNSYSYTPNNSANPKTFELIATNGSLSYSITNNSVPTAVDPNWLNINTQTWAKANLNVGTLVTGVTEQTNNSILEKYCYGNLESNCTTYGALYQWNEAMQYVTTEGAQGICPVGSHIPTDVEWKTLEIYLGMTPAQANLSNFWRGTDQGSQLKTGGGSGLNLSLAGLRNTDGSFGDLLNSTAYWSGTGDGVFAWVRGLTTTPTINRYQMEVEVGLPVRCIGD